MEKILITGGGGFIGLHLARDLVDRGQEVLLVRRHPFEVPSFLVPYIDKQAKVALGDIGELSFLYSLIKEHDVNSIIHTAALHEATGSLYKTLKVNLEGTTEVLEAARIFGLRRVTFVSSVAVYMKAKTMQTLDEDMDLPVASPDYISATKKAGEQICQLYARECGLSVPIVRPVQVWGPLYKSGRSPLQAMVENSVANKATHLPHVYVGSRMVYVYARDCAKAISLVHLAQSLGHDIYNISDGESHSLADFDEAIRKVIPEARITLGTIRPDKERKFVPIEFPPVSIERIKKDVGFIPDYDFERAVRAYIDWVRDGKYT